MVKRGMVFGVFDHFHEGHEFFLTSASKMCHELAVVVTPEEAVVLLKGKTPAQDLESRMIIIKKFDPKFIVISGDKKVGDWDVFETYRPDKVFLGYDQQSIARELDKMNVPYEFIDSHKPTEYKSSLRKK